MFVKVEKIIHIVHGRFEKLYGIVWFHELKQGETGLIECTVRQN